jgi:Skp family chaperone for outer membrane proteins
MNFRFTAAAAIVLAASLVGSNAYAGDPPAPAKKKQVAKKPPKPTVDEQIQSLRQEFQGQIDGLKSDLAAKDAQLRQAQQAASDAQAAAAKAESDATAQQQANSDNSAAVTSLKATVDDMRNANASAISSVTDETAAIRKSIASPDAIHYKGITISPAGSFLAAETVWRQGAIGGDINTQFTGIPLNNADAHNLSEFFGSGRQSRMAIKAIGKTDKFALTGYYEMDWLSSGTTSNANQSNSYTLRQRQLWADAKLSNGWDFSGGQGWSLATETTAGLTRGTEILPSTIDAQYEAGFVWTRQYSFRMSKDFGKKFFVGISAENAETLNPAGTINLTTGTAILIGSAGNNGGLYNVTANYSFNESPDFVAKIAVEPGWGHWEVFGIERNFRDRIYATGVAPHNETSIGGGIGGGFRAPLANKKLTIGLKGLWGQGVGRYGSSTIADVTIKPNGVIAPLHGFSALSTIEINPNPRLNVYFNYGGDYINRAIYAANDGYGLYSANMSGCRTEVPDTTATNPGFGGGTGFTPSTPANCGGNNKDVQEFTAGYWYNIYNGPKGRLRQGLQYSWFERDLWSGAGGTTNPGGGANGTDNMIFTSLRYYLPQ